VAEWTVIGAPDHLPALRAVAAAAEAVTVEFENVSAPALRWLAQRRIVRPGWRTVWTSQNRLREKTFLARNAIPHAPWRPVRTEFEIAPAVRTLGLPLILKTASSGYDGKGQVLVTQAAEAAARQDRLAQELESLRAERKQVRTRIEKLKDQLELLGGS
jgi:5-(carboxyamino)imidazole ribonucleotide synthase